MRFLKIMFLLLLSLFWNKSMGQNKDSTATFKISGYADAYYARYSDSVGPGKYQKFPAISPRSNSFGLNIAQLTEQYTAERLRSTVTLQFGDLPSSAWSPVFNYIQEANVGYRMCKNFWIDAGFFKTHIGTEALLPKDNITSSASVITCYEPWWQSGIKLSWTPNDKFSVLVFIENGYNEYVATNNKKALGMAFNYALGLKGSIGYYNFIGDATPDSIKTPHLRFLNNIVFTYAFTKKFKMIIGLDYISQQNSSLSDSVKSAFVYSSIITLNYKFTHILGIYARMETFNDANGMLSGVIINAQNKATGYILSGYTAGAEWKPSENSYLRLEGRKIIMDKDQEIFWTNGKATNYRTEVMINMGIWF